MGIAASHAGHLLPLFGKRLLQRPARYLGLLHQLGTSHLQQTAVRGMRNGRGLHGRIHNHPRQAGGVYQVRIHSQVDGPSPQLLRAHLTDKLAKLDECAGVAG